MIKQTRFKTVQAGLILGLIEGIIGTVFPTFPLIVTFGFQATIITGYLTVKTVNNIKNVGEENGCEKPD